MLDVRATRTRLACALENMRSISLFLVIVPVLGCSSTPPAKATFQGSSLSLTRTVVVPTLDVAIPQAKSAVWCIAFDLAFACFREKLAGENLDNTILAQAKWPRIGSKDAKEAIPAGSFATYTQLSERGPFSQEGNPTLASWLRGSLSADQKKGACAASLLECNCAYPYLYDLALRPMRFQDSKGQVSDERCFGIGHHEFANEKKCREQIRVLFCDEKHHEALDFFGLDLCPESSEVEVVVAKIGRMATLRDMIAETDKRHLEWTKAKKSSEFGDLDEFEVPLQKWSITHRFADLEGPQNCFKNNRGNRPELYLLEASTTIEFSLDNRGVQLKAKAVAAAATAGPTPRMFLCDSPFLLFLRKRGSSTPFFAMWVDNDELLTAVK